MSELVRIITSEDPEVRNRPADEFFRRAALAELLAECEALEQLRETSGNLYARVRALMFLSAAHRYWIPLQEGANSDALIPYDGFEHLLERRFEQAIRRFRGVQREHGAGESISSALAAAYRGLAFQTLAEQVRQSVRGVRGNQWMFRCGHPAEYPLRIREELKRRDSSGLFPILRETTPVRMDLSHSGWSDIFFLGMDFPEGARVINASIDLAVRGGAGEGTPRPPVEAWLRVIDEPVLRLVSVDLRAEAEIRDLGEVFDYARDYLGLLKAAVIAAGIVPPGLEGSGQPLEALLERLTGAKGLGLELVSKVNDIPKGSRLAVSTNLLASLITACMRATRQVASLTGTLAEEERRIVAARAILGEWLGGSGGGWQDSGGVWPGLKLISGVAAQPGDVEYGVSRGCLLPRHRLFGAEDAPPEALARLERSLVLVHGGMAQDVGPVLEMVTEKYLLRSEREWRARLEAIGILDEILECLRRGDIEGIGRATDRNFREPIQTIIPWAGNHYTDTLIERARTEFGADFWGFWMLGGMAGGGMGFLFSPAAQQRALDRMEAILRETKRSLESAMPFAMDPVVYNFAINNTGTRAELLEGEQALMPAGYYNLCVPAMLKREIRLLPAARRAELEIFGEACRRRADLAGMVRSIFDHLLPEKEEGADGASLAALLEEAGFDRAQHEKIRADLRSGRIGLAQNRLAANSLIEDVAPEEITDARRGLPERLRRTGIEALRAGEAAIVTLAGGVGSRWTRGAGVVKALNPFCRFNGRHRNFVEIHLAKTRRTSRVYGAGVPHVFTTSYLTHAPLAAFLESQAASGGGAPVLASPGRMAGLRLVPMTRDLRFAWEELPQQQLDPQKQKVLESLRHSLLEWARQAGEGSDYTDNLPSQCIHPVGHWYEVPNMLRNGVLRRLLEERPRLRCLMVHNVDTLGADLDPALLGLHLESGAAMTVEVIRRWVEDRGGGLARVDGRVRLVEGLALPSEETEFRLSYYNSLTTWVDIDRLLAAFGLTRADLGDSAKVTAAVRSLAERMPAYITLKDVKKRWGRGQEDIFPVAQYEKLWGDMTALADFECRYVAVPRLRGQQLKDVAQLDGWLRDGSRDYVDSLCDW
jgi:galactokinase/mevalonate kinase-like predicted kinase